MAKFLRNYLINWINLDTKEDIYIGDTNWQAKEGWKYPNLLTRLTKLYMISSYLHHLPIISFSFPMTIRPPEFYLWSSSSFLSLNFSLRLSIPSPLQGKSEWLNIRPPYIIFSVFFSLLYFCTWHIKCVRSLLLNEWKNLRKVILLFQSAENSIYLSGLKQKFNGTTYIPCLAQYLEQNKTS